MRHPRLHDPHHPARSVRVVLPGLLILAAIVVAIVGPRGLSVGLVAVAAFVLVADVFIRIAISSQSDRDHEQEARSRFRRSGSWPDDDDTGPDDRDAGPSPPSDREDPRDPHRRRRRQ